MVGGKLKESTKNKFGWDGDYKKLLNKRDPIDKQILKLVKHGELSIGVVEIKETNEYNKHMLTQIGKYTA